MATHKGNPSGVNKSAAETGVPQDINAENLSENEKITEKYTDDDGSIAEGVKTLNPNRNTDKVPATNAGGYKN